MKKINLLFAVILAVGLVTQAEARVRHHHRPHHYSQRVYQEQAPDPITAFFQDISGERAVLDKMERTRRYGVRAPKFERVAFHQQEESPSLYFGGGSNLVQKARQYIGARAGQLGLPSRLWCADFMNMITHSGSSRLAMSYARRGSPAPYGCTDCVAVTTRRGGGHVGVVSGYDEGGNPILISGNHGHKVGVGTYNKRIVVAYRYL